MLKLDENYSDYVDMENDDYPVGAAKDASSSESYDGTPLLASFMNNVIGAFQGMWKKAFGKMEGINGSPDTVGKSQFVDAVERFVDDKVSIHEKQRGENAHGAKFSAEPGQLVMRDSYGNAQFGVPLTNEDAARRGDIYQLTKGVLCTTAADVFSKTIPASKFPGFILGDETVVRVLFKFGCEKKTSAYNSKTDILTLNFCGTGAKKIFAKRDGSVISLGKNTIGTKTSVFQAYTEMELMYLASLDGGKGGWLILNNPIVLSKSDAANGYTIYSDGRIEQYNVYTVSARAVSIPWGNAYESSEFEVTLPLFITHVTSDDIQIVSINTAVSGIEISSIANRYYFYAPALIETVNGKVARRQTGYL